MSRKRFYAVLGLVAVLGVICGVAACAMLVQAERRMDEDMRRVDAGMSKAAVVALLGEATYAPGQGGFVVGLGSSASLMILQESWVWESAEHHLFVSFGESGNVIAVGLQDRQGQSLTAQLRRWLRLDYRN